jgi:hypothetical protein
MALAHCILGTFLGIGSHCFPRPLDVPTSSARWPLLPTTREISSSGRWNSSLARNVPTNFVFFHVILEIFYMPQICDRGQMALLPLRRKACWGFFWPLKIRRPRPYLNPRTWLPKASTLPLDHPNKKENVSPHFNLISFDGDVCGSGGIPPPVIKFGTSCKLILSFASTKEPMLITGWQSEQHTKSRL